MHRVPNARFGEPIGAAMQRLAGCWDWFQGVRFWCADPVFTGLHTYADIGDGRSYRDTAHCNYPWHIERPASERTPIICLPVPETEDMVIHELGHVLHYRLGFTHQAVPITDYAETDNGEAFAEAWTGWWFWYGDQKALAADLPTVRLFERITGRNIEGQSCR